MTPFEYDENAMKIKLKRKNKKKFQYFDLPILVLNITEILCAFIVFKLVGITEPVFLFCVVWMILYKSILAVFYIIYLRIREERMLYFHILCSNLLYFVLLCYLLGI